MALNKLNVLAVEKAAVRLDAEGRPHEYQLSDGGGLALVVRPGSKSWVFRYNGRKMGLGPYPDTTLADARVKAARMRSTLAAGLDPQAEKKEARRRRAEERAQEKTIAELAAAWVEEANRDGHWSASHLERQQGLLNNYVLASFGRRRINTLGEVEVGNMLRKIWNRGYKDTAQRVRGVLREIYGYACSIGALKHVDNFMRANDEIGRLNGYHKRPYASLLEPGQIGRLVRDMRAYHGRGLLVWSALNLAPLLAQRPGQLIKMRWEQLDLMRGLWTCPPSIMKQSTEAKEDPRTRPHLVPLPTQAIEILRGLDGYTGRHESGWVFPSFDRRSKGRHISENTLGKALRSMGYSTHDQITPHGFRSMMQSSCRDFLGVDFDTTDRQLAHKPKNAMGATYDRSTLFDAREVMVQRYADLLDQWADQEGLGAPHPRVELRVVEGVA